MQLTVRERAALYARVHAPWRLARPERIVHRNVQGVQLRLPWSHRLPDYAAVRPRYGQNLVELAAAVTPPDSPLLMLDIGANAGDSTAQVLAGTDAKVLCVEADPYWIPFLEANVGADPRVVVEAGLLTEAPNAASALVAVRKGGTTHFADRHTDGDVGGGTSPLPEIPVAELAARQPDFAALRLVKSDTDGFDTALVPAVARAWHSSPVLFFEFDPDLTMQVVGNDAFTVWDELAGLGYEHMSVWDNVGDPLGQLTVADAGGMRSLFDLPVADRGFHFVDVAVCTEQDLQAQQAFARLTPGSMALGKTRVGGQ